MDLISRDDDGGAVLRLSKIELVRFYNLSNTFLGESISQELAWAEKSGQIANTELLASLIGMPRPKYGTVD